MSSLPPPTHTRTCTHTHTHTHTHTRTHARTHARTHTTTVITTTCHIHKRSPRVFLEVYFFLFTGLRKCTRGPQGTCSHVIVTKLLLNSSTCFHLSIRFCSKSVWDCFTFFVASSAGILLKHPSVRLNND